MSRGWFVTGTDTGVGKTRAAQSLLAAAAGAGRRATGMKPVATGCRATPDGLVSDDALALMQAANVSGAYADVNPYAFAPGVSPELAASEAGVIIQIDVIRECLARLSATVDCVVVEGVGGWLAPIGPRHTMADVARALGLPIVLVVGMRLGCLNHALLTQAAFDRSGLVFAGWIANRLDPFMDRYAECRTTLEKRLPAPLLAEFPYAAEWPSSAIEALTTWIAKSD